MERIKLFNDNLQNYKVYGIKGRGVRIVGRLKQDKWTGADGKSYSNIKIIA